MTPAEISLAFAREVAGYPDAFWAGDYLDNGNAQRLPDYIKDWNAVIAEIEKRWLKWGAHYYDGIKEFWAEGPLEVRAFRDCLGACEGDNCAALARAVLDCVRATRSQDA